MKKLALLLCVAVLAACGGGGSSNSVSNSQGVQPGGASATLSLSFQKSAGKQLYNSYSGLSSKTWRRVIVTNPSIVNSAGQMVQFTVDDFDADTATAIAINNIPVGEGYRLEIVDYRKDTQVFSAYTAIPAPLFRGYSQTNKAATTLDPTVAPTWTKVYTYPPTSNVPRSTNLLKPYKIVGYYGRTFTMAAAGTTITGITVQAPGAALSLPTPFHGGIPSSANLSYMNLSTQYKLKVKFSGMNPFDTSKWALRQAYRYTNISAMGTGTKYAISGFANLSSVYTPILIGPSPYDAANNNTYMVAYRSIADFNLKGSLLKGTDKSTDFYFTTPLLDSALYTKLANLSKK